MLNVITCLFYLIIKSLLFLAGIIYPYYLYLSHVSRLVAATGDSDSDEDSDSGLLLPRRKTAAEKKQEEVDYLQWLKGQKPATDDQQVGVELVRREAKFENY